MPSQLRRGSHSFQNVTRCFQIAALHARVKKVIVPPLQSFRGIGLNAFGLLLEQAQVFGAICPGMRFKDSHIFVWRWTGCSAVRTQEEKGLPGAERVSLNKFRSNMIHCPLLFGLEVSSGQGRSQPLGGIRGREDHFAALRLQCQPGN